MQPNFRRLVGVVRRFGRLLDRLLGNPNLLTRNIPWMQTRLTNTLQIFPQTKVTRCRSRKPQLISSPHFSPSRVFSACWTPLGHLRPDSTRFLHGFCALLPHLSQLQQLTYLILHCASLWFQTSGSPAPLHQSQRSRHH